VNRIDRVPGPFIPAWKRNVLGVPRILAAFLWGFAEATLFFVVPDVLLSFVALFDLRTTWRHIILATAGALVGGAFLFHLSTAQPSRAHAAVARVPFIKEGMFTKVGEGLRNQGLFSVFLGSISGIPYKLYAVEAPGYFKAKDFLLATPPARAARFVLVWLAFGLATRLLRNKRGWNDRQLICLYAAVWIASYTFYWGRIVFL
jgi:membrane protein YqaA with SNARE-associated domain